MERVVAGLSIEGVCDRLTNMLLAHAVATKTNRACRWCWPKLPSCCCSFQTLFRSNSFVVTESVQPWGLCIGEPGSSASAVLDAALKNNEVGCLWLTHGYFGHNYDHLDDVVRPSELVNAAVRRFVSANWRPKMIGCTCAGRTSCGRPPLSSTTLTRSTGS